MRLCQQDRDVLGIWELCGIPNDRSTRDAAIQIMWDLWADYQTLQTTVKQLGDAIGGYADELQTALASSASAWREVEERQREVAELRKALKIAALKK